MLDRNNFSVIIVTYNSEKCIIDLLDDIHGMDQEVLSRTLIVDNNSEDQTVHNVRTKYPQVHILENKENVGYGKAVNQGACKIDTDLFFLLNPDIRLPSEFFREMTGVFYSDGFGAIGPLQYKLNGNKKSLNFCWSFWCFDCFKLYLADKFHLRRTYNAPIPVTYLNAGCLLINTKAFLTVGGFDERYFLYGEEPDIFLKFKLHGYESFLHPGVRVIHLRDKSIESLPSGVLVRVRIIALINILSALARGHYKIILTRIKNRCMRRNYA